MAKKIYVLDTSVCLTSFKCICSFKNNDLVIPLKVLDEIDNNKKRQDSAGFNARGMIRTLDLLREKGNLSKGVRIEKGKGILTIKGYNPFSLPDDLDFEDADNQIIATALSEKHANPEKKVILVSRDINMRVKCDALELMSEDYDIEQVVDSLDGLYTGFGTCVLDESIIDLFYGNKETYLDPSDGKYYPNQFIMLKSPTNEKKTALIRFDDFDKPVRKIEKYNEKPVWGTKARNKEQMFALDILMDPSIPIVSLIGKAGSGKTLLALAAALEQTFGPSPKYNKIVVTKPVEPVGKDIGFLPGTMQEKMLPWLAPIQDNLQFLMGNDKVTLDMYIEEGKIEIEAMTYIRGRSISNSFIIIDEVQNMTQHEIKTVLTRVGEGTKIVLTGDIEQIDNVYIDATNNGLTYVVEKLKDEKLSGHITLLKGERSNVATLAAIKL